MSEHANENYNLADDALCGAQEIAEFLRKAQRGKLKASRRAVYHLVRTSRLPTYRLGGKIWARKSVLLKWIEQQEARSMADTRKSA
jgi:hypothetical protein